MNQQYDIELNVYPTGFKYQPLLKLEMNQGRKSDIADALISAGLLLKGSDTPERDEKGKFLPRAKNGDKG